MVERLLAEGRVRITDPSDDEAAEWRRVVNYAKRHGMEPEGRRIEKVPYGGLGLEFFLAEGPHPNARSQRPTASGSVPVPARLAHLHPVVAVLKDDDQHLLMPSSLRRRSLLLLQGLAAEAVRQGHEVRAAHSKFYRREGGVDIVVDGFAYTVTVRQEFPESSIPERSARLVVEIAHGLTRRSGRWRDRKNRTLEQALGVILAEIEELAVEDAEHRANDERKRREREIRWRAAVEEAKELALREQLAAVLREEAGLWREAALIGEYCDALERRLGALEADGDEQPTGSQHRWLDWARRYARDIDPLQRPPGMPTLREPTPDELRPYLKGWSAHEPKRQAEP
ncbi:hypothetical protein NGM36_34800 [Streptomyces mutabilis]|uniref:hypothetical protein n=1 Tax=Streptomyces mutabilis TaxID=67332 RepID=UPI0022BA607E|nr:hypothetical protein [Streptomyces mutabilis]MCZ9354876.1 hypothetical protein [Streptomyces mutabilis]